MVSYNNIGMKEFGQLLQRGGLVCQNPSMQELVTHEGEAIPTSRDGCAIVSVYNALVLNGFSKSFEDFTSDLVVKKCLGDNGIIWEAFNNLNYDLQFAWMQDAELPGCDQINTAHLRDWISSGSIALVKIQSLYGPDRRHFMVALGIDDNSLTCLESSDISGAPKLRDILLNELLGVRYLTTSPRNIERPLAKISRNKV